jgi:hypothetical protein
MELVTRSVKQRMEEGNKAERKTGNKERQKT